MKKLCLILFLSFNTVANAQDNKKFKVGFATGKAKSNTPYAQTLITIEPAYRLNNALAIGFRFETTSKGPPPGSSVIVNYRSYSINGLYYLGIKALRPFVGAGLGLFRMTIINSTYTTGAQTEERIGIYPRVGFDLGHFSLSLDYNLIPASDTGGGNEITNNYLGFRIGFFVGGGKR